MASSPREALRLRATPSRSVRASSAVALAAFLGVAAVAASSSAGESEAATCAGGTASCAASGAEAAPSCCPDGSWPALAAPAEYTPAGVEASIGDLPIYYSGAPGPKAVVVLPEVFGWAGRLKGICDTLAAEGYFVVMPDVHRGDTAQGKASVPEWVKKYPYDSVVGPDLERLMDWLQQRGATSVGAMGFCWGVWALAKASASGVPLKCGVGPHPSTQLEAMAFGGDELAMMRQVRMPVLLMPAGNDSPALKPGGEVCEAIEVTGGRSIEFAEMQHGWTTRGDLADAAVRRDVEEALKQTLAFFRGCL